MVDSSYTVYQLALSNCKKYTSLFAFIQVFSGGESVKIDVRYKLLLFLLISMAAFMTKDMLYGGMIFGIVICITFCMGQWKLALRFCGVYLLVSAAAMLSPYLPKLLSPIALMLAIFIRMFLPLLLYSRVFVATTTVTEMVTAMYAIKLPRSFVITFAVAMRFFPTAKEELHCVRNAMSLRGLGFSFRNLFTRPTALMEGFMTPLMVRASTIADELSASSITRGLDNPAPRTAFTRLHVTLSDTSVTMASILAIGGVLLAKNLL